MEYREGKARTLEAIARSKVRRARLSGVPIREAAKAGKWHRSRANGQRYRFSNAIDCGAGPNLLRATCNECGSVTDHPLSCGATLVCITCRGKLQAKRRANVGNGQRVVMFRAKKAGLLRRNRKGGRWSDKFITLTIPHLREHSIADRIALIHAAWPHFLKAFNAWLRAAEPRAYQLATWYGSHEWTIGGDDKGHPHVQLWFLGPYIDCDVSELWQAALEKAGLGDPYQDGNRTRYRWEGDVIVTQVQEAKSVKGGTYELIKYVVKDIVADGEFVPAALFGAMFEALDGRRLRRGSRGFIRICETPIPCACGAVECYSTKIVEKRDEVGDAEREAIESGAGPPKKNRDRPPDRRTGTSQSADVGGCG